MFYINLFLKRTFDIIASLLAIIIFIPLWIILPIAIKCDSKGPVFFKQGRRTKDGRIFNMIKFRSMVQNAESQGAGLFNYKDDNRVTKVGKFLRTTSLDEIPQLFNVLKGDISLVGPRPSVTYELGDYETLNKKYKKRFTMRGGITGYAQVKGRNEISWDEKVTLDNEYIDKFKKQGVWLDIKILFLTIAKVFKKADIYEEKAEEGMSGEESAKMQEEEIIRIAHLPDEEEIKEELKAETKETAEEVAVTQSETKGE